MDTRSQISLERGSSSPDAARARAADALYATGHWLLSRERVLDAASVFRALAVIAPEDERAWLALGACHESLKQQDLALTMYGTGQALTAPAVRSRLARARVLLALGRDDEAENIVNEAAEQADATGDEALMALGSKERGAP